MASKVRCAAVPTPGSCRACSPTACLPAPTMPACSPPACRPIARTQHSSNPASSAHTPVPLLAGPCLALFRGLQVTPHEFLAWLEAHPFLKRHVSRVFFMPANCPTCATRCAVVEGPPGAQL